MVLLAVFGGAELQGAIPGPTQGLVGYWSFDEGSGTTAADASGNGHPASLVNGISWVAGKIGGAVLAHGNNDYVSIPAINLSTNSAVTVSLWVNRAYSIADHMLFENSANYNLSTSGFAFFPDDGTCGGILTGVHGNAGYNVNCYAQPSSGVWHHLVAIFDKNQPGSTEVSLYVDGLLVAPSQRYLSADNSNSFGNNPTYLFCRGGSSLFTAGLLDDLRLYNRALSAAEIQQLYALGSVVDTQAPSVPANLVATAVSAAQINFSWAASTDNVGVTGYRVFRNGNFVGTTATTTYADTNLTSATTYTYTVAAFDAAGNLSAASAPLTVSLPFSVSLTSPANNVLFAAPATVVLAASVSDTNRSLSHVAFFAGTNPLGSVTNPPYSLAWTNVPAGFYALQAVAVDSVGLTATSSIVSIRVDVPPTVGLLSPPNNAAFVAPVTVVLAARANDSDGTISRVDFFAGTNRLASVSTPPFGYSWSNVGSGIYSLQAVAVDDAGLTATSSIVSIRVDAPPVVSLTNPAPNTVFAAPATVLVGATAADVDGIISRVDFYAGTSLIGSASAPPYTCLWSNVGSGTYVLWAVATDNAGLAATSPALNLVVDTPPAVSLTSPADGSAFLGPASVPLAATATDADGTISRVDFYAGTNLLASASAPPYAYTWPNVTNGTYSLWAAAFDNAGLLATSSVATITVGPLQPPTVSITAPTNQSAFVVAQTVSVLATGSSVNGSISKMEFFDGTNKLGEAFSNSCTLSWQVTLPGEHALTARVTDSLGLTGTSPPVLIEVSDADSDYDGRSNSQELADGTDPFNPASVRPVLLGSWSFDTGRFLGDQGQVPLYTNGAVLVPSWNSNAVEIALQTRAGLIYRDVETNFQANINCRNGTVRFWFMPNWNSSANGVVGGPRNFARLIELGGYGLAGWWSLYLNPDGTTLNFNSMTNSDFAGYFAQPIHWLSNSWYQITLTYSSNATVLYLNGQVAATGPGIQYFPDAQLRAQGVYLGNDYNGAQSPNGRFEALETYNYPLDPETVARDYPNHQLAAGTVDSDYDGRSDFLETQVDKTNPNNPNDVLPVRLGYWRFDSPDWHGEGGQLPLASNGVVAVPGWSGTAAQVPAGSSGLLFRDVETNGSANINCRNGTVMFWFKPNWNSGANGGAGGTGAQASLLELGDPNSAAGWWGLLLNSNATRLTFSTMTNFNTTTCLIAPVTWDSNHWYYLALTYSPTGSAFYLNGSLAAAGVGVSSFPSATLRANGFRLGAGLLPGQAANGRFDELQTFNYPVAPDQIVNEIANVQAIDANLDGMPDVLQELPLAASQPFSATPFVVAGTIEAEQFDQGGNGVGYLSQTDAHTTDYRSTRLAIEACDDLGGGYCVSRLQAGDWMKYTFQARVAGPYTVEVRAAAGTPGGQLFLEVGQANGIARYQTAPQALAQPGWQALVFSNLNLPAGTNTLTLVMAANAADGYVGKINYLSVYPTIPPFVAATNALVLDVTQAPYGARGDGNAANADLNRVAFQSALNDLMEHPGGGTLLVPAGTYFLDKNPANSPGEDPTKTADNNYSLLIGRLFLDTRPLSGIEMRGDPAGGSVLQALDRSTTLLTIRRYWAPDPSVVYSNFFLSHLTFKGRPHIRPDGTYDPGVFNNYTSTPAYGYGLGALLAMVSDEAAAPLSNLYINHCSFINASVDAAVMGTTRNVVFTGNTFRFWDGEPSPIGSTNLYSSTNGIPIMQVGIFGSGSPNINVLVFSNTFNGNPALAPTSLDYTADGMLWCQGGGNWFAAGNCMTNYGLEAIQYNSGPGAVVGNCFVTPQRSGSTAALVAWGSGYPSPSSLAGGSSAGDAFFTFTGNFVQGGREAFYGTSAWQQPTDPSYNLYFCGNDVSLLPPQVSGPNLDWPSCAAVLSDCSRALVAGNLLRAGSLGVSARMVHVGSELLKNDFAVADHMSLDYDVLPGYLQTVSVTRSRLGSGLNFPLLPGVISPGDGVHLKLPYADSSCFFLIDDTFLDGAGNPNGLLLTPPGAPVYYWP